MAVATAGHPGVTARNVASGGRAVGPTRPRTVGSANACATLECASDRFVVTADSSAAVSASHHRSISRRQHLQPGVGRRDPDLKRRDPPVIHGDRCCSYRATDAARPERLDIPLQCRLHATRRGTRTPRPHGSGIIEVDGISILPPPNPSGNRSAVYGESVASSNVPREPPLFIDPNTSLP